MSFVKFTPVKRQTRALGFCAYGIRFLCFTSYGFMLANHINLYIIKTCCDKKTSIGRYKNKNKNKNIYFPSSTVHCNNGFYIYDNYDT
jgi:hypothetical protein